MKYNKQDQWSFIHKVVRCNDDATAWNHFHCLFRRVIQWWPLTSGNDADSTFDFNCENLLNKQKSGGVASNDITEMSCVHLTA